MGEVRHLTLPVLGMTCANCVSTVERSLKRIDGVSSVPVNLASERASVEFDPARTDDRALVARIRSAGYDVAQGEATLLLRRLADDNDARRLEKALTNLEGVLEAQVTYTTEKARVKYVPTIVSQAEVRRAVAGAGFEAVELGGEAEDAEAKAREHEINEQCRLLVIGLIFTIPLFLLSIGSPVGSVVTLSLGVAACIPARDVPPSSLLAGAGAALFRAEQGGRNRSASLSSATGAGQ